MNNIATTGAARGPDAPPMVKESAERCRQVAAAWTLELSGDFMQWNGEPQSW
ncbi:hypothetical protein [Sphingobium baderi]|uniref:hypothetical protein n=1 Tax=Sphingobium baderi TaxID=1332080 RepID=UPI000A9426F0|nr:hypothetical protein [Sphingobium baderi]